MPKKYPQSFRERAMRMVTERLESEEGLTRYQAIGAVASKLDVAPETLRRWFAQADVDARAKSGVTTVESVEIRRLRRENAELRRANEILKTASAFFRCGARPALFEMIGYIDMYRDQFFGRAHLSHVGSHRGWVHHSTWLSGREGSPAFSSGGA